MEKTRKQKAKHGGHNPDNVLLGLHVSPEAKAVAKLTAMLDECDVTTLLLRGLWARASAHGITDMNGNVTPEYKQEVEMLAHKVRTTKKERQNNGK